MWTPEHRQAAARRGLRYPSDLTDAEWALIEPMIPPARRGGRPRDVNVREVLNGIFYVLWTGCQWSALPKDLPPKSTAHHYFMLWDWDGTLERIHHALYVAVRDGRMLGLIKAWLEMPVEEDDGEGGRRRTNRARRERKGTPQGSPISPLVSNIYMRRFILGWKALGYARRFRAEIVNYADDLCVLGKAPAAEMLAAVERLMAGLKLTVNTRKTRCLRCPEEPLEFLGYRIGHTYRPNGNGTYIGTRPSKASVQSICRRISDMTDKGVRWATIGGDGGASEPDYDRVDELLQPRAGQPGLQRR